ncbi:MAG: hypothetical protein JXB07_21485, partial [Anaerolineae bacterium]|nr:hypothetical protein [Anaerolineae bacterium]
MDEKQWIPAFAGMTVSVSMWLNPCPKAFSERNECANTKYGDYVRFGLGNQFSAIRSQSKNQKAKVTTEGVAGCRSDFNPTSAMLTDWLTGE